MSSSRKHFFWVDLEMTGLDDLVDSILEVAGVVTDLEFNILDKYHHVVFQPKEVLDRMNDWCKKTHGDTGLTAAVPDGKPLLEVERDLLALIEKHYGSEERVILVGNSVGNDKRFVDRFMPAVAKRLHYRLIDVSSFKEVFRDKYNIHYTKKNTHRAIDDILESIGELKHYLSFVRVAEQSPASTIRMPEGTPKAAGTPEGKH